MEFNKKRELLETFLIGLVYPLLPGILFSLYASFVEGGFTVNEIFDTNIFYWVIGIGFTLFLLSFAIAEYLGLDSSKTIFGGIAKMTMLLDPQKSLIGQLVPSSNKFFKNFFNVWVISLVLFSIIGIIGVSQNQFFTQIPATQQQVTPTGKLIYSVEPGADAETTMFIVLTIIQLGILYYISVTKGKLSYTNFLVLALLIIPVLIGVEGLGLHELKYAGSELSLFNVFLFWYLNALIYILTGVVVFWFVWHQLNNLFFYLAKEKGLISNESLILLTVVILFIIIIIWAFLRLRVKNKGLEVINPNV